jgi:hypothetical protein
VGLPRWVSRAVGLDVHREFCVVAICEDGVTRSAGRVPCTPDRISRETLVIHDSFRLWRHSPRTGGHAQRALVVFRSRLPRWANNDPPVREHSRSPRQGHAWDSRSRPARRRKVTRYSQLARRHGCLVASAATVP